MVAVAKNRRLVAFLLATLRPLQFTWPKGSMEGTSIYCLKVIADEPAMNQLHELLHQRMSSWPHVIAVGTHLAHCYLIHFQLADKRQEDAHAPVAVKLTDGLKPFHSGDDFVYSSTDPCTGHSIRKTIALNTVHVTCISFLEKSRTVLVGFSFGGIMSISLTSCPTIDPLIYPCSAAVNFIAPLEPDDDPRSHLWFFVAYGTTKTKPLQLCLYEVMFPDEEALPLSERSWNRPIFGIKLVIPFHNSLRWVSTQTLVRDRAELRGSEDSTRDSFRNGSEKDRSLVFFSYIAKDRHGYCLKGGIFDLNAYYYKRLVQIIAHDGTKAQQCAFLSTVHPIPMHLKEEDFSLIKDLAVDTTCITRFISNVSDAEQMFYPSAYEVFVVHVAGAKKCYQLTLPSLPNQLLSTICADLEMHVADASSASTWLAALGFPKKEAHLARTEQYANICTVLYALVSHQRAASIVQFIKHSESTESRHLIATWIWEEVDKATKKMHETIEPLFARFSAPLSPAGQKSLAHVHDVFVAGVQILRELISTGEREQDETKEYIVSLEAQRFATENLRSYSAVIHQLMRSRILPVAEDREIRLAMEKALEERRSRASGNQLHIDKLVARMQRKSPGEPFWLAEGPKWYPPALLNLLGPILLLNIPTKWKGQLLAYYLLDYAHCKKVNASNDSPTSLIDIVTKQMFGLLGMRKEELWNVYKFWCADTGTVISDDTIEQHSPCRRLSSEAEVKQLLSIPRPLTATEEEKLKSLLRSIRFGEFAWQCYLARNNRFDQFKEIPVPPNEENEIVLEYQQLLPVMRMLKQNNDCASSKNVSWPAGMKEAIEKFERERRSSVTWCETDMPVFNRGKTPKPLNRRQSRADAFVSRKRQSTTPLQQLNSTSPHVSTESDRSTSIAKRPLLDFSEDESVSLPRNIPANTLNTITDILRTPQARARAAAQAESQRKWLDKTPETEFQRPAPRSILKSGKPVTDRAASPSRNRLQFDLPSSSQSSAEQITSVAATSPVGEMEKVAQPNFDDSFEYDEENPSSSASADEVMEVEQEEFVPYVSPQGSAEDITALGNVQGGDVLERSLEVQDEDEMDDGEVEVDEGETSVMFVEQQDEEQEEIENVQVSVRVTEKKKGLDRQENAKGQLKEQIIAQLSEDIVEERSFENQDEEEEEEDGVPVDDIREQVLEQQDEKELEQETEVTVRRSPLKRFEKQDDRESMKMGAVSYLEQEEQDEDEIQNFVPVLRQKPGSSCEIQDEEEDFEGDAVNVMRYESVVVRTIETASVVEQTSTSSEIVSGQVTRSVKLQSQFEDEVMITELQDEYEEEPEPSPNVAALASGDYNAPSSESLTTAVNVDSPGEMRVKIVDYSFHESSFEGTPAPMKKSGKSNEESFEADTDIVIPLRPSLELESHIVEDLPVRGQQDMGEKGSDTVGNASSGSLPPQDDAPQEQPTQSSNQSDLSVVIEGPDVIPTRTPSPRSVSSPHPSESDSVDNVSNVSVSKHRSPKKSARTSAPPTPTRQSRRLREKAESHAAEVASEEQTQEVVPENDEEAAAVVDETETSHHAHKHEIPPLSMSLRSRTPHGTSDDTVSEDLLSERKSPARSRKAAREVDVEVLKTPPRPSKEADEEEPPGTATPTRTLRTRTPSRARRQDAPTTPTSKTPRRSRKASESSTASEVVAETGATRKSPSRATRSRRLSTMEEEPEPATSTRKSPSRRTPSRAASASKSAQESAPDDAKTRSFGRAAKSLQKKFEVISNPLKDIDVRSMYDANLKERVAQLRGSRRRTRSDSEVPDIKAKKLKTVHPEETIVEVDEGVEETGTSQKSGKKHISKVNTVVKVKFFLKDAGEQRLRVARDHPLYYHHLLHVHDAPPVPPLLKPVLQGGEELADLQYHLLEQHQHQNHQADAEDQEKLKQFPNRDAFHGCFICRISS
ncbi:hypothetical protein Y032_0018g3493 [Ancylostoma ceylanicum]|uniref:ELYS beta-propeller domain-containing protein n=2 Tax=Ancylostoma ceylanicum TaxID=53326 RepID=A0A016V374_9BILA|nr:hypothetical protein Y032_0018g3493 [Ancylostoma ceylanicum]